MNSTRSATRSFYSASILLLILVNLSSALNFVFQALMRRNLVDADFTLMNVLFRYIALFSLPFIIYTNSMGRRWAELQNAGRLQESNRLWTAFIILLGGMSIVLSSALLPATASIASFLNTDHHWVISVSVICLGLNIIFYAAQTYTTAHQWFILLAVGAFAGALLRIGIAWIGIESGSPLSMAILAGSLSGLIIAIAVLLKTHWSNLKTLPFSDLALSRRELLAPMLAAVALFMICDADLLILKKFYDPSDVHVFTDVNVLARSIFFLIGPITYAVLPKTATTLLEKDSPREKRIVRKALLLGAIVLILAAGTLNLLAPLAFTFLGATSSPQSLMYLRIAAWSLVPLSLCQLIIPSLVARRQEWYLIEFTLLSALLPLTLIFFRGSLIQVFLIEAVFGIFLLIFISFRLKTHAEKPSD
jgi:O-antigen/teichoic acid export membrane protein